MLKIRLQRTGKRGQAYFRLVVLEHTVKTKGEYMEYLGSYDPHKNEILADAEKIKYWISKGAKMSPTANNLLVGRGMIEGEKVQVWKPKKREKVSEPKEIKPAEKPAEQPIETKPEPATEVPVKAPVETPAEAPAEVLAQ